jgi:uncharacterized protein YlxP (DUF503 family)
MTIGVLTVSIEIPGSASLKDKRQVLRSVLDVLRAKFNVSAAELERQDSRQFAAIGVSSISNDKVFTGQVLESVRAKIESDPRIVVLDYSIEFL